MKLSEEQIVEQLRLSVEGQEQVRAAAGSPPSASACAMYQRTERLQYRFMAFFQTLMAVLGLLTLVLLVTAGYHAFKQDADAVNALLAGAAAIVSGVGAAFLSGQRADARKEYLAASKLAARCP